MRESHEPQTGISNESVGWALAAVPHRERYLIKQTLPGSDVLLATA